MPTLLDFALAFAFAVVWPLYTYFIEWPAHLKRVQAGDPNARLHLYRRTIVQQWLIAIAIFAVTIAHGRSLATLWLMPPTGWRLAVGILVPALYCVVLFRQAPAVARNSATRARLRERLQDIAPLVATRPDEWSWFQGLSVTAGFCEEVMFRGFLVWMLTPWLNVWGAAGVSAVIFGLAHSYQGGKFGPRAFIAGILMGLFALATGSILPGIVLHALIDLGSGYVTYLAMREPVTASPAAA